MEKKEMTKADYLRIFAANEAALDFFATSLLENPEALAYCEKRGWDAATRKRWGIGYCPEDKMAVFHYLRSKGFDLFDMFKCGIASEETNSLAGPISGRVTFAIRDAKGKVGGFGARALDDKTRPKFFTTCDTKTFQKAGQLYNERALRNDPTDEIVLVEGYSDVIALDKAGVTNAVAQMGSHLSDRLAGVLAAKGRKVVIALNSDDAGLSGTLSAGKKLTALGVDALVRQVPGIRLDKHSTITPKDWDALLRLGGKVSNAPKIPFLHFLWTSVHNKVRTPGEYASAVRRVCGVIASIRSEFDRAAYASWFAEKTGIERSTIDAELERHAALVRKGRKDPTPRPDPEVWVVG